MKTLIALGVLLGTLSPALAQLPSAQDFLTQTKKAIQQQQNAPPPAAPAPLTATVPASAPYGSGPQAAVAAPASAAYPSGPNGIRPGETTAQCEARVAATKVKIRKGGCRRTESVRIY